MLNSCSFIFSVNARTSCCLHPRGKGDGLHYLERDGQQKGRTNKAEIIGPGECTEPPLNNRPKRQLDKLITKGKSHLTNALQLAEGKGAG